MMENEVKKPNGRPKMISEALANEISSEMPNPIKITEDSVNKAKSKNPKERKSKGYKVNLQDDPELRFFLKILAIKKGIPICMYLGNLIRLEAKKEKIQYEQFN